MKKLVLFITGAVIATGCFAPREIQVKVAPLGEEVPETVDQYIYFLPQTVLKAEVVYREVQYVPGPFWEYAEKYLSISEVITQKSSQWQILDVKITPHAEIDPSMVYQVNVLEGAFTKSCLESLLEQGLILDGSAPVSEEIKNPSLGSTVEKDYMVYRDLGIYSNFEERTETMYKTIVTDTSFVRVPVNRTITEQKSVSIKAQEAAEFLLDLRTRRFELLTGDYEGFPQGEAMSAALKKLDELEESYLSLFTGKTLGRTEKRAWFIVPDSGEPASRYLLGMFSEQLGFVPEDLAEGDPLEVMIEPLRKTRDVGSYFSAQTGETANNRLYYRLPDVVDLKVRLGMTELCSQRISLYQSGALITSPMEKSRE